MTLSTTLNKGSKIDEGVGFHIVFVYNVVDKVIKFGLPRKSKGLTMTDSFTTFLLNISRGTTDPGSWIFSLDHVSGWNQFEGDITCVGFQVWPTTGATCIIPIFCNQVAPLALLVNLAGSWHLSPWLYILASLPDGAIFISYNFGCVICIARLHCMPGLAQGECLKPFLCL